MTTDRHIKKLVMETLKTIARPGFPITKTLWKAAYNMVRLNAIKETVLWKRQYITIERV